MDTRDRASDIVRLYEDDGLSLRAIGNRYGISHTIVRKILKDAGVTLRQSVVQTTEVVPFPIAKEHNEAHVVYILKVQHRQALGEPISTLNKGRLLQFMNSMKTHIWVYYPGIGWRREKRQNSDGDLQVKLGELPK